MGEFIMVAATTIVIAAAVVVGAYLGVKEADRDR